MKLDDLVHDSLEARASGSRPRPNVDGLLDGMVHRDRVRLVRRVAMGVGASAVAVTTALVFVGGGHAIGHKIDVQHSPKQPRVSVTTVPSPRRGTPVVHTQTTLVPTPQTVASAAPGASPTTVQLVVEPTPTTVGSHTDNTRPPPVTTTT
ncbi:MAG TPA: hypothetical protein VFR41_05670, partial [Acidimicrobiia bacterium]|nr:hypothetical protein [Acidimicrobiia bacterium]